MFICLAMMLTVPTFVMAQDDLNVTTTKDGTAYSDSQKINVGNNAVSVQGNPVVESVTAYEKKAALQQITFNKEATEYMTAFLQHNMAGQKVIIEACTKNYPLLSWQKSDGINLFFKMPYVDTLTGMKKAIEISTILENSPLPINFVSVEFINGKNENVYEIVLPNKEHKDFKLLSNSKNIEIKEVITR